MLTFLGMLASLAIFAAGGGWWLKTQFTNQTNYILKTFNEHANSDMAAFNRIELRLQKFDMILHPEAWPHIRLGSPNGGD